MEISKEDLALAKAYRKKQEKDSYNPTTNFAGSDILQGADSSLFTLNQNERDRQDVVKDTLNNWGVNAVTIGDTTYSKTNNGIYANEKPSATGYLFDNISKLQSKANALKSVYKDEVINDINSITRNGINSEEDQVKLDQLNNLLRFPDKSTVMAMQGYKEPGKNDILNKDFGGKSHDKIASWFKNLKDSEQYLVPTEDRSKLGTVYFLYNPTTNQTKVGFAKTNAELRYATDDLTNKGWIIQDEIRTKNAAKAEADFHNIARNEGSMTKGTGSKYNIYGETSQITNYQLNSGSSEIYNGKMFNTTESDAYQASQAFNTSMQTDILANQIKHHVKYTGYVSNLGKALIASGYSFLGDKGYGLTNTLRQWTNDILPKSAYISKGVITNALRTLHENVNIYAGYSDKNLVEAHKDFQVGLSQFENGNISLGIMSLTKTIKALPEELIQSLPDMVALGLGGVPGLIGKALYATAIYNDTRDQFIKNNNYVRPTFDVEAGLAVGAVIDTVLQTGAIHYIFKGNNLFMADNTTGKLLGSLSDIKYITPRTVYSTMSQAINGVIAKTFVLGAKASIVEAIPEGLEQLYQDVFSKMYSSKYKDKSFIDLVKLSANDIAEASWNGALLGGTMHVATNYKDILEPVNQYLNYNRRFINDETIRSVSQLQPSQRADLISSIVPKAEGLNKAHTEANMVASSESINLDSLFKISKGNTIIRDAIVSTLITPEYANMLNTLIQKHMDKNNNSVVGSMLSEFAKNKSLDDLSEDDRNQLVNIFKENIINNSSLDESKKNEISEAVSDTVKRVILIEMKKAKDMYQNYMNILKYSYKDDLKELVVQNKLANTELDGKIAKENAKFIEDNVKFRSGITENIKHYTGKMIKTALGIKSKPQQLKTIESIESTLKLLEKGLDKSTNKKEKERIKRTIKQQQLQLQAMYNRDIMLASLVPESFVSDNVNFNQSNEPSNYTNDITKVREDLQGNTEALKTLDKVDNFNSLSASDKISNVSDLVKEISNSNNISNETDKYRLLEHINKQLKDAIDEIDNKELDETTYEELKNSINKSINDISEVNKHYNSILDENDNTEPSNDIHSNINNLVSSIVNAILNELKHNSNINTLLHSGSVDEYNNKIKSMKEVNKDVSKDGFKIGNKDYRSISNYDVELSKLFSELDNDNSDKSKIRNKIINVLIAYSKFVNSRKDKIKKAKYITYDFAKTILSENYELRKVFIHHSKGIKNLLPKDMYNTLLDNVRNIIYTTTANTDEGLEIKQNANIKGRINPFMDNSEVTNIVKTIQGVKKPNSNNTSNTSNSESRNNNSNNNSYKPKTNEQRIRDRIKELEGKKYKLGITKTIDVVNGTRQILSYYKGEGKDKEVNYDVFNIKGKNEMYRDTFNQNDFKDKLKAVYDQSFANVTEEVNMSKASEKLFNEPKIIKLGKNKVSLNEYIASYLLDMLNKPFDTESDKSIDKQNGLVRKLIKTYTTNSKGDTADTLGNLHYIPYKKWEDKTKEPVEYKIAFITVKVSGEKLSPDNVTADFKVFKYDTKPEGYDTLKTLDRAAMYPYTYNKVEPSNNTNGNNNNNNNTNSNTNNTNSNNNNNTETKSNTNTSNKSKVSQTGNSGSKEESNLGEEERVKPIENIPNTEPSEDIDISNLDEDLKNEVSKEYSKEDSKIKYTGNEDAITKLEDKVKELGDIREKYTEIRDEVTKSIKGLDNITGLTIRGTKGKITKTINAVERMITDSNIGEVTELVNIKNTLTEYSNSISELFDRNGDTINTEDLLNMLDKVNIEISKIEAKCK